MLPVDITAIGASYYVGNCHKVDVRTERLWLYLRHAAKRDHLIPSTLSATTDSTHRTDCSRFHLLFDWTGTDDPTPYQCRYRGQSK